VDGSPRNDEAHQESVRWRLLLLRAAVHVVTKRTRRVCECDYYIHEEMKIYCNRPILSTDTSIERYWSN